MSDPTPTSPTTAHMFTEEQVSATLNRAADDILDAVNAGEQGLRDALNLIANATAAYLTGQAHTLEQVVEQRYDASYQQLLDWIKVAA